MSRRRTTSDEAAISLINTWLTTDFEDGRHQTRIDLIDAPTSSRYIVTLQ